VDRRTQILAAAAKLFRERGFGGVGVDEIGKQVGITGGALYHHFGGKDEILATLLTEAMDKVMVGADLRFDDPRAELEFLVHHHARFVVSNLELVAIYAHEYRSLVDPWRRMFARRVHEHAATWERTVARCHPDAAAPDVALAVQASIGLLHSVVHWPPAVLSRPDIEDRLVAIVLAGMETLAPPPPP
jgi:AcrR family transcriptional regulator